MILLSAVLGGLLVGWLWARWHRESYRAPVLRYIWLLPIGFVPQLLIAYLPATHDLAPRWLAVASLSASMLLFLAFVWSNRRLPGMPVLLAGLLLNAIVMATNGGWMPISPEVASRVIGADIGRYIALGDRFGQKDVLLHAQDMHFGFLADRFLLPAGSPYQVAFSAGDILIAVGAFWLLARPVPQATELQAEY